ERRELRRSAEVDEQARGLVGADLGGRPIVAEGADVAVVRDRTVSRQPGRAPAEARHPEPLELVGEVPQRVDPERLRGPGDVVLAHGRDDTRAGPVNPGARAPGWCVRSPGSSARSRSARTCEGSSVATRARAGSRTRPSRAAKAPPALARAGR